MGVAQQITAAQQARQDLVARCGFDADRVFMEPTEPMGVIYESLKLLLACVDALEQRVAELEGRHSDPS